MKTNETEFTVRVLFLSNQLPQLSSAASAYQTRLAGLQRGLAAQGVETTLLSLKTMHVNRPNLLFACNARAIAHAAQGYDFIHAAGPGATVAAAAARLWHNHHVLFDVHGDEVQEKWLQFQDAPSSRRAGLVVQAWLLSQAAKRLADYFLVVSEPFRRRYQQQGIAAERIAVVRNGVDLAHFQPPARLPVRDAGALTIAYAGGFQAWQAIDVLIAAMTQIPAHQIRFLLIGFTAQDQPHKAAIAQQLAGRATLVDWLPTDQLAERLWQADVLVIPRTTHPAMRGGCPSKFAEYLALGKPLIVTTVDETADFVQQAACGLVCAPTAAGWRAALQQATQWSVAERQQMGSRARQLAEQIFDWRVIGRKYAALLAALAAEKGSAYGSDSTFAH